MTDIVELDIEETEDVTGGCVSAAIAATLSAEQLAQIHAQCASSVRGYGRLIPVGAVGPTGGVFITT